jgi:hypothetical protein
MKNLTQKALMVVLTVFVLVGLFYGLTTPVRASNPQGMSTVGHDGSGPIPLCPPDDPKCPGLDQQ